MSKKYHYKHCRCQARLRDDGSCPYSCPKINKKYANKTSREWSKIRAAGNRIGISRDGRDTGGEVI